MPLRKSSCPGFYRKNRYMTADNKGAAITVRDNGDIVVVRNGSEFDIHPDGTEDVYTDKAVIVHRASAAAAQAALALGQQTADGVYAGLTADGKQQIYAMPTDLDVTMTFNDAAKAVKKLNAKNALGHNDWQIPALDNLHVLQKNQNQGSLKGTFKTASSRDGSDCPDWYWSSTPHRDYPLLVDRVRFSDGNENWDTKDYFRLSCRPVRLLPVAAPSLG